MEYPITVNEIEFKEVDLIKKPLFGGECGDMVAVRPCADEYEGKTYLGVLLGEIATGCGAWFNKENGVLEVKKCSHNPAIFVPDLNQIIFGYESWWGKIKDDSQLREITDEDIQNVWYVKALKQLAG